MAMAMAAWWRWSVLAVGVLVAVSCSAAGVPEGFLAAGLCGARARNSFQLNGAAVFEDLGGGACALQLTPSTTLTRGSAFSKTPVTLGDDGAFAVAFSFTVDQHANLGSDGMAFVLQGDSATALGGLGGNIGYAGIEPIAAVEFDTHMNGAAPEEDPDGNHVGINLTGDRRSVATYAPTFDLKSGERRYAWVDYDGVALEVRVAEEEVRPGAASLRFEVDLVGVLGANEAYVGFTAATGGDASRHRVHSAVFSTPR